MSTNKFVPFREIAVGERFYTLADHGAGRTQWSQHERPVPAFLADHAQVLRHRTDPT